MESHFSNLTFQIIIFCTYICRIVLDLFTLRQLGASTVPMLKTVNVFQPVTQLAYKIEPWICEPQFCILHDNVPTVC